MAFVRDFKFDLASTLSRIEVIFVRWGHPDPRVRLELCEVDEFGELTIVGVTDAGVTKGDGVYNFRLIEPVEVRAGQAYRVREADTSDFFVGSDGDWAPSNGADLSFNLRLPLSGSGGHAPDGAAHLYEMEGDRVVSLWICENQRDAERLQKERVATDQRRPRTPRGQIENCG